MEVYVVVAAVIGLYPRNLHATISEKIAPRYDNWIFRTQSGSRRRGGVLRSSCLNLLELIINTVKCHLRPGQSINIRFQVIICLSLSTPESPFHFNIHCSKKQSTNRSIISKCNEILLSDSLGLKNADICCRHFNNTNIATLNSAKPHT